MRAFSVTQLNEYVRKTLAMDPILQGITVQGEISNFKRHVSGHWYFSIKDNDASINCNMFRQHNPGVKFNPKDGMSVQLRGTVGLYTKTGTYQLYVTQMIQDGLGEKHRQLEELKQALLKEGLFDVALKKPLPLLPKGVGIVTSKTGAVVHDISQVAWRRNPYMPLYLCDVQVQGSYAPAEIVRGLALAEKYDGIDVIIVGRGGGSAEDLWAFNDEDVIRAIAACTKPVISAVGHEVDVTLSDFVADVRAATPSEAAELAVSPLPHLLTQLNTQVNTINNHMKRYLDSSTFRLKTLSQRLRSLSPIQKHHNMLHSLERLSNRIHITTQQHLFEMEHTLAQTRLRMQLASPNETLKRGYAVVMSNNQSIRSIHQVHPNEMLQVHMIDGIIDVITSHEEGNNNEKETRINI